MGRNYKSVKNDTDIDSLYSGSGVVLDCIDS